MARPALRAEAGRPGADAFAGLSADAQVYVCGPTGFMADVRRWALDAGVSPDAVHGEFASPSATQQARRPAPVDGPLSVCFDGTDVRATWRRQDGTLLELARRRLNPPANCRAGVWAPAAGPCAPGRWPICWTRRLPRSDADFARID